LIRMHFAQKIRSHWKIMPWQVPLWRKLLVTFTIYDCSFMILLKTFQSSIKYILSLFPHYFILGAVNINYNFTILLFFFDYLFFYDFFALFWLLFFLYFFFTLFWFLTFFIFVSRFFLLTIFSPFNCIFYRL